MRIGPIDLAILVAYSLGMVAFGLWAGRGSRSTADYMVGGRNLPWWLILFSIISTETSAVTFLSIPGFAFGRDLTWIQVPIGFFLGRLVVSALLMPQYFQGNLYTSYEVLARRFGGATKQTASVLFIATRTLADGLRLFLSAIVLQELAGISLPLSVAVLGVTMILYSTFGGIRAVLWTDLFQFVVYIAGAIIALALLVAKLPGGFEGLLAAGEGAGKLRFLEWRLDWAEPYNLWAGIFGGLFITLGSHGVDQLMVQRYFCSRGLRDARKALVASGFVIVAQFALFLIIGIGLYAFYQQHPPAEAFTQTDRVFARFILTEMPVGVVGVLLGAIFAAAMGSSLNSCATTAVKDLFLPWNEARGQSVSPERELRMTRILTAVFGVAQIAVGVGGQWLRSSVVSSVLGIAAFTTGIVLGVFALGMFTRRVGQRAALTALLAGFAGMTAIYFLTPLAWPWYALVGSGITFGAGLLASLVWRWEAAKP